MLYSEIWFTKPGVALPCFLINGLGSVTAERLVEALNEEFPDCNFWEE
jgi:hypothetical protein